MIDGTDNKKFYTSAVKHLLEWGMVDNPTVINQLVAEILASTEDLKDVELLIKEDTQDMIIFLDIKFWAKFRKRQRIIADHVFEIISKLLPSFSIRIITDRKIFKKRLEIFEKLEKKFEDKRKKIEELTKDKESKSL